MKTHPTFEVLDEIGRGSVATVYRAWDLGLQRYVAIKEMHEKLQGDERHMEVFWEEAQFLANLKHDNIVQIHSMDKERGWIIMELMEGSLDTRLAAEPLPADLVRSVLRQTLNALVTLHGSGKLHGSVWPGNILINERGRVKLSDSAGITLVDEIRRPTGSARPLAPELLNPEFGPVGTQVDLYCLGLAALEMLKGPSFANLFKGVAAGVDPELAWMRWHSSPTEVLPPLKEMVPAVPPDLAHVVDKLLLKNVDERYATAAEALQDLDDRPLVLVAPAGTGPRKPTAPPTGPAARLLAAMPTHFSLPTAPAGSRIKPAATGARGRWPTTAILALVGMVLFGALALGLFWRATQETEVAQDDPRPGPDIGRKYAHQVEHIVRTKQDAVMNRAAAKPDLVLKERDNGLAQWKPRAGMSSVAAAMDLLRPAPRVPSVPAEIHDFTLPLQLFDTGGFDGSRLAVSRNSAYLVGFGGCTDSYHHQVHLWHLKNGELVKRFVKQSVGRLHACFSVDSKSLFLGVNGLLSCYSVPEGELVWSRTIIENAPAEFDGLVPSPDGSVLRLAVYGGKTLITLEPRNGAVVSKTNFYPELTFNCFCAEGTHALCRVAGQDCEYAVVEVPGMKETGGIKWTKYYYPMSLSLAGDWIAGWSDRSHSKASMDVWKASSKQLQWSIAGRGSQCCAFSPDGKWLLRDDDKALCLHNAATGQRMRKLDHPKDVTAFVFLPDGKHVVTSCDDGKIRVWQVLG
jgi:hypothetical protein